MQKVISKKSRLQAFIVVVALLMFSACEKKASDITSDSVKKAEAKQIVLSSITNKKKNATEHGIDKLNGLIKGLDFEELKIEKDTDTSSIIVVPAKVRFETLSKINNLIKYYLIIKVVNGGVNSENILAYKPENQSEGKLDISDLKLALKRKSNAKNGVYIFMNYTGSYLYSLNYENNQLQKLAFPTKKSNQALASRTENGTVCVDWYHVTYYYDENGYFLYKNEEYLYQTCYACGEITPWGQAMTCDYLSDDTGGGGGIICDISCVDNFVNSYANVAISNNDVSIETGTINALEKYKNPKWEILVGNGWRLYSQELGKIKLVNVSENKWVWTELTHSGITFIGVQPPQTTVTHSQGVGTPSFVPGAPNVLVAGMEVDVDVTFTPECKNCTRASDFLRPVTNNYKSYKFWNAKP